MPKTYYYNIKYAEIPPNKIITIIEQTNNVLYSKVFIVKSIASLITTHNNTDIAIIIMKHINETSNVKHFFVFI